MAAADTITPLTINIPRDVKIRSAEKFNHTGVLLEPLAEYRFEVIGHHNWKDWFKKTDADGYDPCYLKPVWWLKRSRNQPWFKLMGAVGRDAREQFAIGKLNEHFQPTREGELLCYANDAPFMYWNNCGSLTLRITRIR